MSNPDVAAEPRYEMLTWDWKEQVDLARLAVAISRVSRGRIFITEGETGGDSFGVIVSNVPIAEETATELIRNWPHE